MGMRQPAPAQEAPAQAAPEAAPESGGVTDLVVGINDNLTSLMDILGQSAQVTPQDKQRLAGIIQEYQSFVEENLGAAPGQEQAAQPGLEQRPQEAGAARVQQAL